MVSIVASILAAGDLAGAKNKYFDDGRICPAEIIPDAIKIIDAAKDEVERLNKTNGYLPWSI